ncbi:MAG: 6-phosphogluconolactonase [Chlorobiaceae bacterium]|nr:6-phosphogluconolactonase [Chlorobiaceae bacterium]
MNRWTTGNDEALIEMAAAFITAKAYRAVAERGRFTLVLSGGSTPRRLYEKLGRGVHEGLIERFGERLHQGVRRSGHTPEAVTLPWAETFIFQGDERYVPAGHPDSNYGMVRQTLLKYACIRPNNLFRMPVESGDPEADALRYEKLLRTFFRKTSPETSRAFPTFDLVILGLGDDGHTASLFPEQIRALKEQERWVIAVDAPLASPACSRLTLTLPVINHAESVMFLVPAERYGLARSIHEGRRPELPAGMVRPLNGNPHWFVAEPSMQGTQP